MNIICLRAKAKKSPEGLDEAQLSETLTRWKFRHSNKDTNLRFGDTNKDTSLRFRDTNKDTSLSFKDTNQDTSYRLEDTNKNTSLSFRDTNKDTSSRFGDTNKDTSLRFGDKQRHQLEVWRHRQRQFEVRLITMSYWQFYLQKIAVFVCTNLILCIDVSVPFKKFVYYLYIALLCSCYQWSLTTLQKNRGNNHESINSRFY